MISLLNRDDGRQSGCGRQQFWHVLILVVVILFCQLFAVGQVSSLPTGNFFSALQSFNLRLTNG